MAIGYKPVEGKALMAQPDKSEEGGSVRAVDRAISILKAFRPEQPSMSVIDIQERVGLSRPTVYRLLETLIAHGLVRAHGKPQRFSLDYAAGQLGQAWVAGLDVVGAARPVVERLHGQTKETVSLALLQGVQHLYVIELTSPHALSMSRGIGPMEHLTRGASGKAILAFMKDKDVAAAIAAAPKDVDAKALQAELTKIRRQGYAMARGEVIPGVVAVAAPYFDRTGAVLGALVVFGPEVRLGVAAMNRVIALTVESAGEISKALGFLR